jgi:hypothetical protein
MPNYPNARPIAALLHPEQAAKSIKRWYLPLTAREHTTYDTYEQASTAAVRLCVILGVPIVTPLSTTRES